MENNLSLLEEFDIEMKIQIPHLIFKNFSATNKKSVAFSVLSRKPEEILLINSPAFCVDAIFAGLSEKQIEFIAKNSPLDYKKYILELLYQKDIKAVFEIAKDMDQDLGENITQNQKRVSNVIQYIKDNQIIFEF